MFRIALWCLVVGLAFSALGVTSRDFWNSLWRAAVAVYEWGVDAFDWAWDYMLIGAAVVIPIVIARLIWRAARSR